MLLLNECKDNWAYKIPVKQCSHAKSTNTTIPENMMLSPYSDTIKIDDLIETLIKFGSSRESAYVVDTRRLFGRWH